MTYKDELYNLYKIAGMQRPMNHATMEEMDSAYSSLRQVVSELEKLGITSYSDIEKLKK